MTDEFRYDVAFSFLSAHEALAVRVSDGLTDRLTTFVYTRRQEDVIGRNTDGVEAFSNAFRHESRVCVILHSDGWGKTGYTRIEETAVKERAYKEGWEFLIVVCLDDTKPPKWIPTTKIWYGYEKFGHAGLLATIDNRVTELGGRPKQDSVLERAARAERERDFDERKQLFGRSVAGFKAAGDEITRLGELLAKRVPQLAEVSPGLGLEFAKNDSNYRSFAASSPVGSFVLYWQPAFSNSLTNAGLLVVEWGGRFMYSPGWGGGPPKLGDLGVTPTIDYADRVVWQVPKKDKPLSSEALLDYLFERLLDRLNKKPKKGGRVTAIPPSGSFFTG
jgi:hypothetical protein